MIVAARVVRGESEPHEFVFFITYLAQVRCPSDPSEYVLNHRDSSMVP